MSCTASDLPRASLNYVAGIEDGDPIALWPLLLVLLYMISWKMAFSNAVFWLDCLTGGVLLVCSVWRCMYIGGETICGQVLDAVAGSSSGILPESNAYHFTHFSTILWCTSVCFEGHSVILLGKRLRAMRGQHQGGQQCSIVNTTCLWAAGLGTAFMATVFVVHFTNIYIHQSLSEVSLGMVGTIILFFVGIVEGGKLLLQGLVLCGYLFGLDIKRDRDIHYDLRRIGCSNFVMLINCLGLVYSFSPLKPFYTLTACMQWNTSILF